MTIPEQKIFITVKGFYIFLGQCFAKEINFYFLHSSTMCSEGTIHEQH